MNLMHGIHSFNIMVTVDQSVQCNILGGLNLLGLTCWLEKLEIKIPVLVALNFVFVYFMHDLMCETDCLIYVVKCVTGDSHQG